MKLEMGINDKEKRELSYFVKIILLVINSIVTIPFVFWPIIKGLDHSWVYAINYFVNNGYVTGRDIFFTSGPLAFMIYPVDVGNNLGAAFIFQGILWIIFITGLVKVALQDDIPLKNLLIFTTCLCLAIPLICFEYYFSFIVLFFLALFIVYPGKFSYFLVYAVLFTTGVFTRLSIMLFLLPSFVITAVWMALSKKGRDLRPAYLLAVIIFAILPVSVLVTTSSLEGVLLYARATSQIISNYSVAMGELGPVTGGHIYFAIVIMFSYITFTVYLYRQKNPRFLLTLVFLPSLAFLLKHSVVLNYHNLTQMFFPTILVIFGIICLFLDLGRSREKVGLPAFILLLVVIFPPLSLNLTGIHDSYPRFNPRWSVKRLVNAVNLERTRANNRRHLNNNLGHLKLPGEMREAIGNSGVTIIPWEISIAAANNLNFIPLPVFQTYSAYTPFLDDLNASSLVKNISEKKTPEFIITEMRFIEKKHPLVEIPSTWQAIYKWYDSLCFDNDLVLLKRRKQSRYETVRFISSQEFKRSDVITIPDSSHPVIAKISMNLNSWGKVRKQLYRIPEVCMVLKDDKDEVYTFRVIPDNLVNGVFINYLPLSAGDIHFLSSSDGAVRKFTSFTFSGKGSRYYNDDIKVEFFEFPEISISLPETGNPE
jgi:hypothetical protein